MSTTSWSIDLRAWAEGVKADIDTVVREVALELLTRIVMRSPVGNPEIWAANAEVMRQRASYNDNVARTNSLIDAHPEWRLKYGRLKKQRTASARTINRKLPLPTGKGYVGGRFRANWRVSIGAPDTRTYPETVLDPTGQISIGAGIDALGTYRTSDGTIHIMNSLPYAQALEFQSHSKQAPAGMVRVTIAEVAQVVAAKVREVSNT